MEGSSSNDSMDVSDDEEINVVDVETDDYRQRTVSFNESATPFVSSDYVATSPVLTIDTNAERNGLHANRKVLSPRNRQERNQN